MRRTMLLTTCVTAGLAAFAGQGLAQLFDPVDGPVCRRPEVLDVVRRELQRRVVYAQVDWASVSEEPTGTRDVVRCGVRLDVRRYDFDRAGPRPDPIYEEHFYDVRSLQTGFVVLGIE